MRVYLTSTNASVIGCASRLVRPACAAWLYVHVRVTPGFHYSVGETTISATDDIGHNHIGHKARVTFFVNQGGLCAAASQGSGVADGIPKNLKWSICGIANNTC